MSQAPKRKAQRVRNARPLVVVMILERTSHNPDTRPPTKPRKRKWTIRGLNACYLSLWLLIAGAGYQGVTDGSSPQAFSSAEVHTRA